MIVVAEELTRSLDALNLEGGDVEPCLSAIIQALATEGTSEFIIPFLKEVMFLPSCVCLPYLSLIKVTQKVMKEFLISLL